MIHLLRHHIVRAPPALRRFLDARERGASQDVLMKLASYAMDEQRAEQAKRHNLRQADDADSPDEASR
jgi:hypothetical protein